MSSRVGRWLAVLALLLLPLLAVPLVGAWAAGVSAVILAVVAAVRATRLVGWWPARMRWTSVVVVVKSALGGVIGFGSALNALAAVGAVVAYPGRVGAWFAALALSVIAGTGGLLALRHPVAGAAVILVCGLAVPLWLTAAVVGLIPARTLRGPRLGCASGVPGAWSGPETERIA